MRRAWPLLLVLVVATALRFARAADPRRIVLVDELARPSLRHPLGCGDGGVDLLAVATEALLRGLLLALVVAAFSLVLGTTLGAAAGLRGGVAARALTRLCDGLQAFPSFVLALALVAAVPRPSRLHVAVVLSLTAWAPFTRLALAELRVIRGLAYVEAARALGAPPLQVLLRHAIPAALPTARAQLGSTASALLVSDAALAFLGLGPADGVSLGALVDQGVGTLVRAPHVLMVGAGALTLSAITVQALADRRGV